MRFPSLDECFRECGLASAKLYTLLGQDELPLGASVGKREEVEDIPSFCPKVGQMFILKPLYKRNKYFKKQNKNPTLQKKEGPSLRGLRSKSCPLRSGQEREKEVAPVTLSS